MARDDTVEIESGPGQPTVLYLRGRLDRTRIGPLRDATRSAVEAMEPGQRVVLDLGGVTAIDSSGIAVLLELRQRCEQRGLETVRRQVPDGVREFLRYTEERTSAKRPAVQRPPDPISRLGEWALHHARETGRFIEFVGECILGSRQAAARRRGLPLSPHEVLYQIQRVGSEAMPLVFGLAFLLGVIMAFQSAHQLGNLGPAIFVANAVTVSTTREMGPLMTAVIVAGRSGSAFAVQLGTMRINEEIDALTTMGFDVTRYLVLPRVFALLVATPLLVVLADLAGILGGLGVGVAALGLGPLDFVNQVHAALRPADIYSGLVKGAFFGLGIAVIGCFRGLRAGAGPESVGAETTSAVVGGILYIILADAVLSGIFHVYGW